MIPEILFELCSGQKCGLRTDRWTSAKQYTPASSKGGIISAIKGRKHCEKRRNCFLQAISPFLTMFSTAIYLQCVKMRHCVVMGYYTAEEGRRLISAHHLDICPEGRYQGEGPISLSSHHQPCSNLFITLIHHLLNFFSDFLTCLNT